MAGLVIVGWTRFKTMWGGSSQATNEGTDKRMRNKIRSVHMAAWLSAIVVSLSAAMLFHIACIWKYGSFYIQEPNRAILVSETIVIIAMLVFGITELLIWSKQQDEIR